MVGIDISKDKHDACIGAVDTTIQRKLSFSQCREGLSHFEKTIRKSMPRPSAGGFLSPWNPPAFTGMHCTKDSTPADMAYAW